jgi:tetratricopeptide (TPR) repeat protein
MKKLILSIALCCAATNFFAQNADPAQLVNDGKAALEAKNYQEAYTKFSTYLTQTNNQDSVIAYNCGVCADKIKKPAEALKYFDIAVQKKYNLANAYIGKAGALKDLKKNDESYGQQYSFHSKKSISCIIGLSCDIIKNKERYIK